MNIAIDKSTSKFDWMGIVLSAICAVHCLIVPLVLPLLITLKLGFIAEEGFEFWSWTITLGLCLAVTVYQFFAKHKHGSVFIPLALAIAIVMNKEMFSESAEPIVACLAGLLLVATHILNIKMCKSCAKCKSQSK